MKRFYTLMLSAAVAVSAMASPLTPKVVEASVFNKKIDNSALTLMSAPNHAVKRSAKVASVKGLDMLKSKHLAKAPRKAAEEEATPIEGVYNLTIGDFYNGEDSKGFVDTECEVFQTVTDSVAFDSDEFVAPVFAGYNGETGEISFTSKYVQSIELQGTTFYIFFEPFAYDEDEDDTAVTDFTAQFNEEESAIEFPADHGFSWTAYFDFEKTDTLGTLVMFDMVEMSKDNRTWTMLEGKGTWYEDMLTIFSDVEEGQSWEIDIEECDQQPGVYRMIPYAAGSPIATMLERADDAYVVVNATDPEKVYIDGDMEFFGGAFMFSHVTEENGWNGSLYATLKDKVITFPAKSVYYNSPQNGWTPTCSAGAFKIALPGAVVKDYTLKLKTDGTCNADGNFVASITAGADVASLKYIYTTGYDKNSEQNAANVNTKGTESEVVEKLIFTYNEKVTENTIFSLLVNAYNADGELVAFATTHNLAVVNNDENWKDYGTAKFTDGFLTVMYDMTPMTFDVNVQQDVNAPGHFRFEAPYASTTLNGLSYADHSAAHKHYIYVNATLPDSVYMELSSFGLNQSSFGAPYGWSMAGYYLEAGYPLTSVPAEYFGKMEENTITIPAKGALLSFNNEPYNNLYSAGEMKLEITKSASSGDDPNSIKEINATSDSNAAIYNLRGQRVANPTVPGLYIRNGAKMIVR